MSNYIKNFVSGCGISFEISKRNHEAFERAPQLWSSIYKNLQVDGNSIIMFCGAKNNGKSSLVRYVTNQYIKKTHRSSVETDQVQEIDYDSQEDETNSDSNDQNYAYYVDYDPGQPEMTTPGIVSAHLIKPSDPLLTSPTYLNVGQHESLILSSIGGTNMSVNPKMYIENCRFVFNRVKEHRDEQTKKHPIFINTMGFIRNVGLAMLMDIIKICNPTNLVVLNVDNDPMRTIYADLSPSAIRNIPASFYYETNHQARRLDYKYHIYNLEFSFVDSTSIATKNRTALQLAYFASMPEALYKPIMQLNSKWLSLKSISIFCVSSYPLQDVIVLELLYHSWVHLVKLKKRSPITRNIEQADGGNVESNENTATKSVMRCKILDEVGENTLLGCGIVADIDMVQERISIITPISQEKLDTAIDCLIKPLSIQVPREILQASGLQ